jgi:hypothetical protein
MEKRKRHTREIKEKGNVAVRSYCPWWLLRIRIRESMYVQLFELLALFKINSCRKKKISEGHSNVTTRSPPHHRACCLTPAVPTPLGAASPLAGCPVSKD